MKDTSQINGLGNRPEPKSARIWPPQIMAVRSELSAWLARQPETVQRIGNTVLHELDSASVGREPNPAIVRMLAEDVAALARAALTGDVR